MKRIIILIISTNVLFSTPDIADKLSSNSSIFSLSTSGSVEIEYTGVNYQYSGMNISFGVGIEKFLFSFFSLGYYGRLSYFNVKYYGDYNFTSLDNSVSGSIYLSTNSVIPYISLDIGIDTFYHITPAPMALSINIDMNTRYGLMFQIKDSYYFDLYLNVPIPIYFTIFSTSYYNIVNLKSITISIWLGIKKYI